MKKGMAIAAALPCGSISRHFSHTVTLKIRSLGDAGGMKFKFGDVVILKGDDDAVPV